MKRAEIKVYLVLGLLLVAVVVFTLLNQGDREIKRALEDNREFLIKADGDVVAAINLQTLLNAGPQEFSTPFATSVTASRDAMMRGVELRFLLESLGIELSGASHINVSGLDSYYSPLSVEEVSREGTVYICFSMDGEILKPQSEGGYGPFLMVIRDSRFAQRWCKYVATVEVVYGGSTAGDND